MSKVYLSGPIAATNYDGAVNWYEAARALIPSPIKLIKPMRGKEFLKGSTAPTLEDVSEFAGDPLLQPAAITGRDRWDAMRVDAVLMNLTGCNGRISIGCMIEAGWADAARVPIVLCMEAGNPHAGHPILETLATYRTHSLSAACQCIAAMFLDDWR